MLGNAQSSSNSSNLIRHHILRKILKLQQRQQLRQRQRHYWKNMDSTMNSLEPPITVHGMQKLDRAAFEKRVYVPRLLVQEEQLNKVLPLVKRVLLKMENLRPVRAVVDATSSELKEKILENSENIDVSSTSKLSTSLREILLHPLPIKSWESLPTEELKKLDINASQFSFGELKLTYANWRADEILKFVLSVEEEGLTSYSRIGHIVHLNIRDHLLPYKRLIGEVLLDKVPGCRTVVNKAATIDNIYRNFRLELICGDADYQVKTKENGVTFEFDFSKVYWNPRLSTEHERIVQILQPNDVLYDVFAGVGPFAVPAARKRCFVMANDLNPDSFLWLEHNVQRNKCSYYAKLYTKDGRDFILDEVKSDLYQRWTQQSPETLSSYKMHITMNLPALAVEFLDVFRGLFQAEADKIDFSKTQDFNYPIVHIYTFAKGNNTKSLALKLVEDNLGLTLKENLQSINFVRNVAPNKDMYRISFYLNEEILCKPIKAKFNDKTNGNDVNEVSRQRLRKRTATDEDASEEAVENSKVKCQ